MSAEIALQLVRGAFALDVRFEFRAPGVTALFGPSGSGKSTIVHAVAGLVRPDAGTIMVDGETVLDTAKGISIPAEARRIGVVFQDARLFPHMDVEANLLYGRRRAGVKCSEAEIRRVVTMLGLEAFLKRRPRNLSGGERSRVALGRALLMTPRALLLDEPLAALDQARKNEILPYLERLRDETLPILYVSHSLDEVARLADRMIVLKDGRVAAEGSLFDVTSRLDPVTGKELLPGTVLEAVILRQDGDGLTVLDLAGETLLVPRAAGAPGDRIRVRIDPQDVMLALTRPNGISANNILAATVDAIRDGEGVSVDVRLSVGSAHLVSRITRRSAARLGLSPGLRLFAVIKSVTVGGRPTA